MGCDPKSDSSRLLVSGRPIATVVGTASDGPLFDASSILMQGIKGITCVEAGGPEPGVGCAGRGITRTFELLEELDVSVDSYDIVVYDVLGDVVCGGFAMPMRSGYARHVAVVVSGSGMSLFAANNIMKAVRRFHRNGVRLAGLVGNYHTGETFRERLPRFAEAAGTRVLAHVPFDPEIQRAEENRMTICDFKPESSSSVIIRELARKLLDPDDSAAPSPLTPEAFDSFLAQDITRTGG
jgi:nitrogenase iron protein NifH